jgi:competence protein ComEA
VERLAPSQLVVYVAVGIIVLVIGIRWIAAGGGGAAEARGVQPSGGGAPGHAQFAAGAGGADVVVDVTGAVRDAGVYRMPAGSRVNDAVKRAGGATGGANLEAINLAARLGDGQQVVVPRLATASGSAPAGAADNPSDGPISLGTATVDQLDTIEGIGPVTAQHIVDFRDQHGGLGSIEELDQIPGIGPATMQALRSRLQP